MRLRAENDRVKAELGRAQLVANTSQTLLSARKAAQEQLLAQTRQLESDNLSLLDDLGFFEKLMPLTGAEEVAIRGLQAEVTQGHRLRWRVLLVQSQKNAQSSAAIWSAPLPAC